MPLVSVVVPLYNTARFVAEALASLQRQSMCEWEAVVVDDGSTDGGPAIVESIARADPRIRLLRQMNRGLAAARNMGIAQSCPSSRWLHFLDSDDWMLEDGLGALIEAGERSKDGLACGSCAWRDQAGNELGWSFEPPAVGVGRRELLESNRFQVHAAIVRRDVLGAHRFDESLAAVEDWDLWLRLTQNGRRFAVAGRDVGAYRLRPASMSRDPVAMCGAGLAMLRRAHGHETGGGDAQLGMESAMRRLVLGHAAGAPVHLAAKLLRTLIPAGSDRKLIEPAQAAHAAWWMVPFSQCLAPSAWNEPGHTRSLCTQAAAFFRLVEDLAGRGAEFVDGARRELATACVEPARIAAEIVGRCKGAGRVILWGIGNNGARVARSLSAAGIPFEVWDDGAPLASGVDLEQGCELMLDSGRRVRVVQPRPADAGDSLFVASPGSDAGILSRLPGDARVIRWCVVAGALSGEVERRLVLAWPGAAAGGLAAA